MKVCISVTLLICLLLPFPVFAVSPYQQEIYSARDRVLPALIHIQPVVIDYITGREKKHSVVGSGIIISADGYAVTNYHVAGRAERIICTLHDREQVPAVLIGGDPATDLAVIKLDLSEYSGKLDPAVFGSSSDLQVGQTVLALGSPLALSRSLSKGVISTLNRFFPGNIRLPSGEKTGKYNTWLQTDAAINPGNSGGPLVNLDGEVMGINTRGVFFAENIGFSIPVDIVKEVTAKLIEFGKVDRSWIGVHAQPLQDLESFFGTETNRGVLIASIDPGSPAEKAGLKAGQIILKYNGHDVSARFEEELPAFYQIIASSPANTEVEVVLHNGDDKVIKIIPRALGALQGDDFDFEKWGFTAKAITNQMAIDRRLDDTLGVFVTQSAMAGAAFSGGLHRGDVIMELNNKPVNSLDELKTTYDEMQEAEKILLTINRSETRRLVLMKLDNEEDTEDDEK
ncbi:MAG: trypsin-like peptidase domain-containing protein [candidate division Zixibacteria bacterium]|nr:trypsin-like peptidase domain-containing protein [candidate division Zixibacteria bacterium]